ncbi:auxin efflux carrier [Cladochytrium replicatum]|nr:auxin efflux carrier [Cladochytrium replicatum]
MSELQGASMAVLEVCIPILVVIAGGVLCSWSGLLPPKKDGALHWLNKFVYYLGLPAMLFNGLAPEDLFTIDYSFALSSLSFLLTLHTVALFVGIYLVVGMQLKLISKVDPLGQFLGIWINTTWVNLFIFGVPILSAFMDAEKALQYNVLAAFSSFGFQWPVMIFLFELRKVLRERSDGPQQALITHRDGSTAQMPESIALGEIGSTTSESHTGASIRARRIAAGFRSIRNISSKSEVRTIAIKIGRALITNPTIISCLLAVIYSLAITSHVLASSTVKFPKPLASLVTWLANTVTPLSTFCIGLFMFASWKAISKRWKVGLGLVLLKNTCVPLFAILLSKWFGLQGESAQALVLMTGMPMALGTFPIFQTYNTGEEVAATTVIMGTLLMMPTAIAWNAMLGALNDFHNDSRNNLTQTANRRGAH